MMTPTQPLAAFVSTQSSERLPTMVYEATKQHLLDTIGCGIYGSQTSWAKILSNSILKREGRPETTCPSAAGRGSTGEVASER